MQFALQEAQAAEEENEVPFGAIIVHSERRVIASDHNRREQLRDPTAHAEMLAITQAAEALGSWRLDDCTLYVTLEPCPMCAGAIFNAKIPRLYYGARDKKAGAISGLLHLFEYPLPHKLAVTPDVLGDECLAVLKNFFEDLRE